MQPKANNLIFLNDFYAVSKNSTAQLLQATKPNTTTKLILAQLKQIKKINLNWL